MAVVDSCHLNRRPKSCLLAGLCKQQGPALVIHRPNSLGEAGSAAMSEGACPNIALNAHLLTNVSFATTGSDSCQGRFSYLWSSRELLGPGQSVLGATPRSMAIGSPGWLGNAARTARARLLLVIDGDIG